MPEEALGPSRRLRVAIAEDDDDQRQALEAALVGEGFEVISFEDGAELLDFFELESQRAADVIIADLNMPGRSGLDGLEQARARGVTTPIFVVTGESGAEVRARVMRLGNALYLPKPIDATRLAEAIYRVAALTPSAAGP